MAKLIDKMIGIMGFADDEPEEDAFEEQEKEKIDQEEIRTSRKNAPVVSIHTQKQMRVVVLEPNTFEDAQNIADQLKSRRPVIVNLENAEKVLAKRIVDFISGTTYALNGNMQKVGNGIFLFVPNNVDISGEMRDELKVKGLFWSK
ncbi:cell division protein SepF [Desulfosporosinus acididurans]|uniref:Cell division protein SepF n=1 Tax=Desulfosporosinus acididurans TaxID=476652 RepID=A0A0J1FNC3_9FIRM|nr:cell division protein SepF [Desulfosporosinus acididurans]KLU64970.1 cell division protein SepF [Desulfosporosinus acididurans]